MKYWLGKKRPDMIGNKYSIGIIRSAEFKKKVSEALKGRKFSKETRRKISLANSISQIGRKAEKSSAWKGGKYKTSYGYIKIHQPSHPFKDSKDYVFEHRLVMEKHIGRYLKPEERVHHINEIKDDNGIENLQLVDNMSHHRMLHRKQRHCNIENCEETHYGRGLCRKHYAIWYIKHKKSISS